MVKPWSRACSPYLQLRASEAILPVEFANYHVIDSTALHSVACTRLLGTFRPTDNGSGFCLFEPNEAALAT
jgi:hypothetical protein